MINTNLSTDLQNDILNVTQISAIPSILNVICRTTGMKFSAVARVTDEKWITCVSQDECNFGLKTGDELVLETTICNEIKQHHNPVIIDEVVSDVTYCNHPTPAQYGFQSYISYPIYRKNGSFFGTLCAIDPEPAKIDNQETKDLFALYAQLISFHLDAVEEINDLNIKLKEEKHIGELRETFIAILGHDLRNPVGTTRMCADILLQMDLPEMANRQASTIKSTSYRMQGLIDNLLDFAKGHLGEGIRLDRITNNQALKKSLNQVTKELKTIDTHHKITLNIDLKQDVNCDINRVGQLYSNLLGNAVKHGAAEEPIIVDVLAINNSFSIRVSNSGDEIPEAKMLNLFKPFFTTNSANNKSGLGLGLYISSEIAKAHNGIIEVTSTQKETNFVFSMPI
ncbi:GAF domain-containing sensor histidine kinase [Leeuwenhoekiella sp. W20_SRS_FM14]|uniref:GAF domain-containing sensor histidine kinase n=1 Tax=Leeuwenhoekiella sp. W20_SRS_FM14 TaxID=3240270 RepID=UPI003F9E7E45